MKLVDLLSTRKEREREAQRRRIILASNDILSDCFTVGELADLFAIRHLVPGFPPDRVLDSLERRVNELTKAAA